MTSSLAHTIGVDISKDVFDVAFFPPFQSWRFDNNEKGFRAFSKKLGKLAVERIVFEPTGPYHRLFERTLAAARLPLVKVNPRHARRFAQASGKLAKTDPCDAAMLAHMGAALQLEPRPVASEAADALKELQGARDALVKDRVALLNRQKVVRSKLIGRQIEERLAQIDAQIKEIEREQAKWRKTDDELARRFEALESIPGFGEVTCGVLLVEMPELGRLDENEISALAGLAPIADDSGKRKGVRNIYGGRGRVRQALYMPALNVIQKGGYFHDKFKEMVARGKPSKVALTAIMRKLLIIANALLRTNRKWSPKAP